MQGIGMGKALGALREGVVCLLLVAAGTAPLAADAQPRVPEKPHPRLIGVAEGLPSSDVTGLARDRQGYLWVATHDGLARYDGVGTRVWQHVPGDPKALPGNSITAVHVDDGDRLWVAVEGRGISMMEPDRTGFRHYNRATSPQIASDDTFALAGRNGVLWFGTYGGGLHRLGRDGRITRYPHRADNPRSPPADNVFSLAFDQAGDLWVGTNKGLARWTGGDSADGDFDRLALPGDNPTPLILSVTADPKADDALWIGASTGVFRRERDGRWTPPDYSPMFATPNAVLSVVPDGADRYWFASQRYVWRIEPGKAPVPMMVGRRGPARVVQQLLKQDDGALWFPAVGRGLGYLRADWQRLAELSREHDGLRSDLYRAARPASAGGWWLIGTQGVERLDEYGVPHPLSATLQESISSRVPLQSLGTALEDGDGQLWIGTSGTRIRLLRIDSNGAMRLWEPTSEGDATLPGPLNLMALAPDGSLWMSYSGEGLQQRDRASGRVLDTILPDERGLQPGDVQAMHFSPDGQLWLASSDGLSYLDVETGHFRTVPAMRGDQVYAFAFDGDDGLWLQRLSGLEHYRREAGEWKRVDQVGTQAGIPPVEGSGLHVDAQGQVWLATLRGLYRWDPRLRRLRAFGMQDGLSSREIVDGSTSLGADGVLTMTLENGGVVLLDTRVPDTAGPRAALLWDGFDVRRDGRWQPQPIAQASISPDDHEFRVQLRLLAFDDPGAHQYFTRLEGYDRDWVAMGAGGERVFARLPPGRYRLSARATDADGQTAEVAPLRFEVLPAWWQTAWARLLVVVTALGAVLGVANAYRMRVRRRHAWQMAEQQRELAEQASQAKTRFLATLGHEVRTPMTGVLGMSELLLGTPLNPQQRGYVGAIRGAGEHLLRLVNDALDLARIESGKLELADEAIDLHELVEELGALIGPLARQRGLAFESSVAGDAPRHVRGDAARVRQILLNLLGNAVKFTERGRVALSLAKHEHDGVCFEVTDTGPGLNTEQKARLFRRFEQVDGARTRARYGGSGLGLAISQELAAAMSGTIEVESTPGEGTRFKVRLPLPEVQPPGRRADAPSGGLDVARSFSLLLVEDDPTVADVLTGLLRLQGHHVVHVPHGLAALATVATTLFDAALLDLDLPGMDGLALARQLRIQGFTRPLVAVTARADAGAEPEAMEAGFDHFIRKPMTLKMLEALLQTIDPASASRALDETSQNQQEEPA